MEQQNFSPGPNDSETSTVSWNLSNTQESYHWDPTETTEFKRTKVFFYFFILTCSTLGNIVVAWIICSSKKMRTPSNFLILNLSICDLITPLMSIPLDFALEENDYIWFYGKIMCKFVWPCATLTATSSSLTLAAISFDRYRFIMHPFKTKLSWRQTQIIATIVHITSLLFVLPYIYVLELQGERCVENWPEGFPFSKGYTLILFLIQYAIPLVFMVVMYSLAISRLRLSSEKVRSWSTETVEPPSKTRGRSFNWYRNLNAKATTMFIIIVVVFAVFMFPNQILWLWLDFGENNSNPYLPFIQVICWLFTYTNSVSNPMVYFTFSSDFRNGLKKIMSSCKRCSISETEVLVPDSRTETDSSLRKMSIVSLRKSFTIRKKSNT